MSYMFDASDPMFNKKVKYRDKVGRVRGYAKGIDGQDCYVVHLPNGIWHTFLFPIGKTEVMPEETVDDIRAEVMKLARTSDTCGVQDVLDYIDRVEQACRRGSDA